ncbi:MAG: DUF3108 domain-containing protein [Prevotellaceae bacterium]|jgi:hypothetical protein|nr:DUF3108 domain-containing protein [Prevotellaceae bacterium]
MIGVLCLFSTNAQVIDMFDGEHLKYNAKYGAIKGGEVVIDAKRTKYQNEDAYHVKIDMYSTGLVDNIFHFHDIFESYFSPKTQMPYLFVRDAHEGKYTQFEKVFYYDTYVESTIKGRFETGKRYYDVVSGIFALRKIDWSRMKVGEEIIFPIYFDEKVFDVKIVYDGKIDIKLNGKIYHCRKFTPIFTGTGMFSKNGVSICLTDDYRRKPVQIKVNFRVGSFKVELVE